MFSNVIRTIYLYLVSFISLMIIVGGTVLLVNSTIDFFYPTTYYYSYEKEIDYRVQEEVDILIKENPNITENELNEGREKIRIEREKQEKATRENDLNNAKRRAAKSIATSLALLIITTPIYLFHFKNAMKDEVK